ncbi:6-phosphogluconolactonase [Ascidiimonas sp. W6]|uniref:6-phosphogluconolactonase n=1 Tax=Ascidiimonas meishanensis TaxID=3128903 RepID=UPI0030ED1D4A
MIHKHISHTLEEVAKQFSFFLYELTFGDKDTHIALSGGSTPKVIFDVLASDFADKINWKKVHLYWGDERCVPPTDEDSNYKMTVNHLLSKIDIPEENIHRIEGENIPQMEAYRYGELLQEKLPNANGIPQFDLIILGIGEDGHTASIFPHEINIWDSYEYCDVASHPKSGQKRITITGQVINNAKAVAFLATGFHKANKVKAILKKEEGSEQYPASLVDPTHGEIHWFLDEPAAGGI